MSKNKFNMEKLVKETFELNEDHFNNPGDESSTAKKQVLNIIKNAEALKGLLNSEIELDAWVQSKLAVADSHIQEVANYMEAEAAEGGEGEEAEILSPVPAEEPIPGEEEMGVEAPSPEGQDLEPGAMSVDDEEIDLSPVEDIFPRKGEAPEGPTEGEPINDVPGGEGEEIETEEEIENEGPVNGVLAGKIAVKESLEAYLK